jgi:hypothetical protein
MPFASCRRHEYWSTDVYATWTTGYRRMTMSMSSPYWRTTAPRPPVGQRAITRSQDSGAFLSVLYEAIKRYGSPEALVTDGEARSSGPTGHKPSTRGALHQQGRDRAREALAKLLRGDDLQHSTQDGRLPLLDGRELARARRSAREVGFGLQRAGPLGPPRERADGRRSPQEVLGWLAGVRYHEEDLQRAFFSSRSTRKLDLLGYARFRHWRGSTARKRSRATKQPCDWSPRP